MASNKNHGAATTDDRPADAAATRDRLQSRAPRDRDFEDVLNDGHHLDARHHHCACDAGGGHACQHEEA